MQLMQLGQPSAHSQPALPALFMALEMLLLVVVAAVAVRIVVVYQMRVDVTTALPPDTLKPYIIVVESPIYRVCCDVVFDRSYVSASDVRVAKRIAEIVQTVDHKSSRRYCRRQSSIAVLFSMVGASISYRAALVPLKEFEKERRYTRLGTR